MTYITLREFWSKREIKQIGNEGERLGWSCVAIKRGLARSLVSHPAYHQAARSIRAAVGIGRVLFSRSPPERRTDWANTRSQAPDFSIPWQRLLADCKILRRSAAATAQAKAKLISFRIAHWAARCREEHGWFYSYEPKEFRWAWWKRCAWNATRRIEWRERVAPCQNS